jgi:hypothetical protein
MPKINMRETEYYKSGAHTKNVLEASKLSKIKRDNLTQGKISNYNDNPSRCEECSGAIDYHHRLLNRFCSRSCSAKFSNRLRPKGHSSRTKSNESRKEKLKENRKNNPNVSSPSRAKFFKIQWLSCTVCQKEFYVRGWSQHNKRKSCGSQECKTHLSVGNRTYRNGRRKLFYYFNKHQDKTVLLESTWEYNLAQWLDEQGIVWERPLYIKWYDEHKQKQRLYYPDFYLPEINLYLDPKNPTALRLEKHKMDQVSKLIPIVYGDMLTIKESVLSGISDSN